MQTTITDINIFENYPHYLFAQLPEQAKTEMDTFVQYLLYKYKINFNIPISSQTKTS